MFSKLVYRNAKRTRKENAIYFATLNIAIASFYVILSLGNQDVLLFLKEFESDAIDKLLSQMPIIYAFALFLLFFLILFANQYQLTRRKKEFGLYLLLGMRKERLIFQLFSEALVTSVFALVGGLVIGVFLAEIISLTVSKLVGQGIIGHQFSLSIEAIIYSILGFLLIQFIALFILGGRLFKQEIHQLIYEQTSKKQHIGRIEGNIIHTVIGAILLCVAYGIVLNYFEEFGGLLLILALVLGVLGTFLFLKGFAQLIGYFFQKNKRKATKGLYTFTIRQFQENIANKSTSIAITSILMTLAIILLADGASSFLSLEDVHARKSAIYDFTIFEKDENEKLGEFLQSDKMNPYVSDLGHLKMSKMISPEGIGDDGLPLSYVEWSLLKEEIIQALPSDYRERYVSGNIHNYSISADNHEAINLLGVLDIDLSNPYLIRESSYNELLKAIGEKSLNLQEKEIAIYFNPDYMPMDMQNPLPIINQILAEANKKGKNLISIQDEAMNVRFNVPWRGLVADRSLRIHSALIVPDEIFEKFADQESYMSFWNFRIPEKLQEEQGLMTPMLEVQEILKEAKIPYESYLHNFGRQLYYVVAGSYTILYLGIIFLLIACTVLALQFLTQLNDTRNRYITLSMLGAKREQMKKAMYKQVLFTFLLPISLAVISGAVGIRAMISFVVIHVGEGDSFYLIATAFALIVLAVFAVYGIAVARTASREITKIHLTPHLRER